RGVAVVGLEPSCLLTMRDEFLVLGLGDAAVALASQAMLFEEFLAREHAAGRLKLALRALPQARALIHGHCHQKAFDAVAPVRTVLGLIPSLKVETIESGCCGMAGAFGYEAERSEEHTSELQSRENLVCRLLLEKKKKKNKKGRTKENGVKKKESTMDD